MAAFITPIQSLSFMTFVSLYTLSGDAAASCRVEEPKLCALICGWSLLLAWTAALLAAA